MLVKGIPDITYIHKFMNTNNGLVQERHNSIANAMELHLSCTNPLLYAVLWSIILWDFCHGSQSPNCLDAIQIRWEVGARLMCCLLGSPKLISKLPGLSDTLGNHSGLCYETVICHERNHLWLNYEIVGCYILSAILSLWWKFLYC